MDRSVAKPIDNIRAPLLAHDGIERVLNRLAHEIHDGSITDEKGPLSIKPGSLAIIGIRTGGAHLARRLAKKLSQIRGEEPPLGILDITLYRDDVLVGSSNPLPLLRGTDISFSIDGRNIILVDDVLFTGRTVRAAMGALSDLGRPGCIRLAVLADRGLRELPIAADYIGRQTPSSPDQRIEVELVEEGADSDAIVLVTTKDRRLDDRDNPNPTEAGNG
jgi:pyrimidine operon attenuation protein / uracil phosphoribosyltransferase